MVKSLNKIIKLIILLLILIAAYSYSINYLHFSTDFVNKKIAKKQNIKILFVGDIMLDRGVAWYADKNGKDKIFAGVKDLFDKYDLVVGNLEGTITSNQSVARKNNGILRFTFDPSYSETLREVGFQILNLANNHALDFGLEGYNQTIENLDKVKIKYFGSPKNDKNLSLQIKEKNKSICFVGYHDLFTYDERSVVDEIFILNNKCDFLIVFSHWGDEYKTKSNLRQQNLAHRFIDMGADLVIGTHPHVIQEFEDYKGKRIYYSLGNFVFDQDFSYNTMHGNAVGLEITDKKTNFEIIPIKIEKGTVSLSNE